MDPQEYIVKAIEDETDAGDVLEDIKHVTETSLLEIADDQFPCCIVEDETMGEEGTYSDGQQINERGKYMLAVIVKTVNLNKMTRADYKEAKSRLADLRKRIIDVVAAKFETQPKMDNMTMLGLNIGDGAIDFIEINSNSCLVISMPVETKFIYLDN